MRTLDQKTSRRKERRRKKGYGSIKVLDENNRTPISCIIRGIYWCVENDIDVINMSFGSSTESRALKKAVQDADKAGILVVAAAGNGGAEEG